MSSLTSVRSTRLRLLPPPPPRLPKTSLDSVRPLLRAVQLDHLLLPSSVKPAPLEALEERLRLIEVQVTSSLLGEPSVLPVNGDRSSPVPQHETRRSEKRLPCKARRRLNLAGRGSLPRLAKRLEPIPRDLRLRTVGQVRLRPWTMLCKNSMRLSLAVQVDLQPPRWVILPSPLRNTRLEVKRPRL